VYLTRFTARGIKCFQDVTLDLPARSSDGSHAGWNVILGVNATGKTTLLQAMAASLIGPAQLARLISATSWIRPGETSASFSARFVKGEHDIADGARRKSPYEALFNVIGDEPVERDGEAYLGPAIFLVGGFPLGGQGAKGRGKDHAALSKGPYAANKRGWLVCGYGAHRRLSGGAEDLFPRDAGRPGRVASLFSESVALMHDIGWLPRLYAKSLDHHDPDAPKADDAYKAVRRLVDQLLPPPVRITDVTTEGVLFSAPGATRLPIFHLSDGCRSFLALVLNLLRQIADAFGTLAPLVQEQDGALVVTADGVVLIDEVDLHLHPSWQREIGPRLLAVFPNLQFIVTSHSPFVAQAAMEGGLFVLHPSPDGAEVTVSKHDPRVAGWNAQEILQSDLFGLSDTRDPETGRLLDEHAALKGKQRFGRISAQEKARLAVVARELEARSTAPGELSNADVDHAVKLAAEKVRRARGAEADPTPGK
jgi:AAA domain, putative AbiEii toxin, Type IV TA system/AAA domain